jgi:WD40 repeat protein
MVARTLRWDLHTTPTGRHMRRKRRRLPLERLTGERVGFFDRSHDDARLTAATFDAQERRLVTAGNDGSVHIWVRARSHAA